MNIRLKWFSDMAAITCVGLINFNIFFDRQRKPAIGRVRFLL